MSDDFAALQDHYALSAEWYDILSERHWKTRHASVLNALRTAFPDAKRVLDIGSGTGMALKTITEAFPQANIHAIEPSATMRVGLMTRVLANAKLRGQVTVHPTDVNQATLPENIDVALACGCVGFLDKTGWRELCFRLAAALSPAGVVLVDVMPLDKSRQIPESQVASTTVGEHCHNIWLSGQPVEGKPELIRWHMRFRQVDGDGRQIRDFSIERDWRVCGLQKVLEEAAEAGFKAEPLADSPVPAALMRLSIG